MALRQYRIGGTYYGYDPLAGQAIAFSNPETFQQYFPDGFDPSAAQFTLDPKQFENNTDKIVSVPRDLTELARRAGEARVDFGSLALYLQDQPTGDEVAGINRNLGIEELEKRLFSTPPPSLEKLYTDAYGAAGLSDIKKQFNDLMTQVNTRKGDLNKALGVINENPWLSEAGRLGRSRNLQELASGDINNVIDQAEQISDLYNSGLGEVNNLVSLRGTDAENARTLTASQLEYMLQKADREIARLASEKNSKIARYLPEYLDARTNAEAAAAALKAPETIGSAETGYFAWDPNTRTFRQVTRPVSDPLGDLKKQLEIEKLRREIEGDGDSNEVLSPTDAEKLGVPYGTTKGEAARMGITPQRPLSAEAQKLQGNIQSGLRALDTVKNELFGPGSAQKSIDQLNNVRSNVLGRAALPFKFAGNYTSAERELKDVIVRLRTGAAITDQEEKFYQKQLPSIHDNETTIKSKLKRFEDLFKSIAPGRIDSINGSDTLFQEYEKSSSRVNVDKLAAAIGKYESGGNYKAMGPVTKSGDRAYGKYQVMGANIASWTKAALGKALTAAQFLANPKEQDAVARHKMGELLKKYGRIEDVASVWFSGKPLKKAGNARDVIGTTVPKYVANITAIYNRLT